MSGEETIETIAVIRQGKYLAPEDIRQEPVPTAKIPVWGARGVLGFTTAPACAKAVALVTCRGNGCGLVQWTAGPSYISNNAMSITPRSTGTNDARYLYYSLLATRFSDVITGSAQPQITITHLSKKQIHWHGSEWERASVARILGTLDDKIELNRQMNETLEAMARALFKSWFVDFDPVRAKQEGRAPYGMDAETAALFPDGFEDSELGPIPKGWRVLSLDEIASFLNGLALQKFPGEGPDSLPVIKIRELRTGVDSKSNRASREIDPRYIVDDGDLLFSWSGSLVVTQWSGGVGALNQHLFKVTSDEFPKWFVMGWLLVHLPEFQGIAADKATTMGHIKRHHLTDARVVVPPQELIVQLTAVAEPLLERQLLNELESRTLAELRDTLLPKLISGELRVPEAEALAEAAQ